MDNIKLHSNPSLSIARQASYSEKMFKILTGLLPLKKEAIKLIKSGFGYVTTFEDKMLFRKPK